MMEKVYTDLGTCCAESWNRDWVARVNDLETELGHRVCGARCLAGTPCPRASKHESGRCTHHGGHHLIGAQAGNCNARLHGLYALRLQICGPHCARWESCPFAEAGILDLPATQRPNCPFEQQEYEILTAETGGGEAPGTVPLRHTTALFQVMLGRAAAALAVQPLTEVTRASTEQYSMESTKVSAALDAFLRLAREHRRYVRELSRLAPPPSEPNVIGIAEVVAPLMRRAKGVVEEAIESERKERERKEDEQMTE